MHLRLVPPPPAELPCPVQYAELHCRSAFSLLEGAGLPEEVRERLLRDGRVLVPSEYSDEPTVITRSWRQPIRIPFVQPGTNAARWQPRSPSQCSVLNGHSWA